MTVEQNVLQQHAVKHQQTLLNQLREVTGTTDVRLLQHALQVCNGDLAEAVAFLTGRSTRAQNESAYYQTSQIGDDRYINVGSQSDTKVIDLTREDKDDLQRAIALSLAESSRAFRETGITDEEQAISRVLEASIAENKASLRWSYTEAWTDSPDPHDRKRQDDWPVGLKNVGNTCWFSAVIQSLFNLLEFQRLVLHYSPPEQARNLPRNQKEHRNLPFMQELRHLFSLMVGSERKYVDPSRAVEILKDAFEASDSQQQQDVSEFTHKLLDWLEDAFQMKADEESDAEKPKNPMLELFYGRFLAVGVLEGKQFENTEMFGQYPLQVNGFKDLHECLEAAMVEGEIESLHSENSAKSGQEHWFTELPPVLTFELSRFEFNQTLGRPEKIHNKLEFPPMLYVDRYMVKNREVTRIKREEIRKLKEHLMVLQQRLERYLSYGSGPKKFPLADVLEYAMEFASSKPVCGSPLQEVEVVCEPPGGAVTSPMQPAASAVEQSSPEVPTSTTQQRASLHKPFTQTRVPPEAPRHPAPRHVAEEELRVLQGCLHRWRSEVESDTRDLQGSISRIHRTIELMYSDKSMMQIPYRLHAVLVHEGQANAGHYWAYVYSPHHCRWLKYNDVSVTKSSWEELMRDSFGGYRNASAYCLMYINDKMSYLVEEKVDKEAGRSLSGLDKLPSDLKAYVMEDNRLLQQELQEWDAQQARKAQQETQEGKTGEETAGITSGPPKSTGSTQDPEYMEHVAPTGNAPHVNEDTQGAIRQAASGQEEAGGEALLSAPPSETSPAPPLEPAQDVSEGSVPNTPTSHHIGDEGNALPHGGEPTLSQSGSQSSQVQPVIDEPACTSPAEDASAPPSYEQAQGDEARTPSPAQAVLGESTDQPGPVYAEVRMATPSPVQPKAEEDIAPPPTNQPLDNKASQPMTEQDVAPPPVDQPVAIDATAPPCDQPLDNTSEAAPPPEPTATTPPTQRVVEVSIPHVGTFVIQAQDGGYDDEAMMTPNMQGIIMAIGKAKGVYDKCGPEAAFFQAIKLEYTRLLHLAQEDTPPGTDHRLQHIMVYLIQNQAPNKIVERTLLTQFADRNLGFDELCKNVMKVALAKLELIKPDEVNIEECEKWHQEYQTFKEMTVALIVGVELYVKKSYTEALLYLIHSYQCNRQLVAKGPYRGHNGELIGHLRRDCLLRLNKCAAALFESGGEPGVSQGLTIMNELVVPCLPLLLLDETQERDVLAVEDIRNQWCSYLGQEMEPKLQETLNDFLPRLLDCSAEHRFVYRLPKLPVCSALELCERFNRAVTSLHIR